MTNAATTRPLKSHSLAVRLEELAGRMNEALHGTFSPNQVSGCREAIQDLRAEAESQGVIGRFSALERISLLTEVWECLATYPQSGADEVGHFCANALIQLARCEEQEKVGDEGIVDWILDQSSAMWGEYLALLESQGADHDLRHLRTRSG